MNLSIVSPVTLTLAAALGSLFGLAAVGLARTLAMAPLCIALRLPALGEVRLSLRGYLANLMVPLCATVGLIGLVLLVRHVVPDGLARTGLAVAAGTFGYAVGLLSAIGRWVLRSR